MQDSEHEEQQGQQLGPREMLAIAKRRIWWIILPALVGPVAGYLISRQVTPVYTSQAFVLVQQQKVPDAIVPSMVTDQLESQLLTMQDQILSRSQLQPIIEEFGLYKDRYKKASMDDLVARLRSNIKVTPIRPDSNSAPRGFYVAVDADKAKTAQEVCSRVLSMFMAENLQTQAERAENTSEFLSSQLADAKAKLDSSDSQLAEFKSKYMGRLPSDAQANLQMMASMSSQLDAVTESLAQAQQQRQMQAAMMASQSAAQSAAQKAPQGVSKKSELEQNLSNMRLQLATLRAHYTDEYPDVQKLKAQIATLQSQLQMQATQPAPAPQVDIPAAVADSPELVQARVSIAALDDTIRRKKSEQAKLSEEIAGIQGRIQMSPMVEEQFKGLTRDYESSLQFYNDLLSKKTQSQMVQDLEQRREGEQFHVMDPPALPSRPSKPDKVMFALGGLAAGFALGVLLAVLIDLSKRLIRTEEDIATYIRVPLLVSIQDLEFAQARNLRGRNGS